MRFGGTSDPHRKIAMENSEEVLGGIQTCPWHHWAPAEIQNPNIPSRTPQICISKQSPPSSNSTIGAPPRTHIWEVVDEEVKVTSCSQRLEVKGIQGNPLGADVKEDLGSFWVKMHKQQRGRGRN